MTKEHLFESFNPHENNMFTVLNEDGSTNEYDPQLSQEECMTIYKNMVRSRTMDEKAFKLQRSGKLGTFAQAIGQEGCQAPVALLLDDDDWVVPAFREQCLFISAGNEMKKFFQYYGGNEIGNQPNRDKFLPVSIVVGSHPLHATGIAWAQKIKGNKATVFTYFGDGATSEGQFHEAMNFAGVFKVPVVFIAQNNQYAISLPVTKQTASKNLAQKSCAYGFPGMLVDGNDPLAVYVAAREAKAWTREGKGPALLEFYTYRLGPHTTADDPTLYRTDEEVERWKKKDPILRFETYLKKQGWLDQDLKESIEAQAKEEVEQAVKDAQSETPTPEDIFKWTYKEMTPALKEQLEELQQTLNSTSNNAQGDEK
ncbi:pyruvate dehydrogenase (acetyl-transferring) E1 component subunit alpha [Candidatus Woesearchaeota archaeon]|nr:MAG: pyruvate dehydrogenase (acetyl-transferring) E1 component subunit alpha [Candidatus Woesearchaeota archaeon]